MISGLVTKKTGKRRGRPPKEDRVPPGGDPSWPILAEPLLAFLGSPRNWTELIAFGRQQRWSGTLLRNCLAWLENRGLTYPLGEGKAVRWTRTGWSTERPKDDGEDPLDSAVSFDDLDEEL